MPQFSCRFKPNWLPSLNPQYIDLTGRMTVSGIPTITVGTQRRENPFLLTYGEMTLTFDNADGYFDPLFDLDKIMGTDPLNLRAPLLHYGRVILARREFGRTNYQNVFFGFLDPKTLKFNRDASTCSFTAWGVAKMLEKGNAERVHRFSYLYSGGLPNPYVLTGYDLGHPAAPPGYSKATGTAYITSGATTLNGNLTLFTTELQIGNIIQLSGTLATITDIASDGVATISAPWGGITINVPGIALYYSGQNDAVFRLSRDPLTLPAGPNASTLPFLAGDTFQVVSRILPTEYSDGMDVNQLDSTVFTVKSTAAQGTDLLITVTQSIANLTLFIKQASIQLITPWWQYQRYTQLIRLLVAEVNNALSIANYTDVILLVQDAFSATGSPTLDFIDLLGLPFPSTGIAWAADGGGRALLQGSGLAGVKKADILLDAALSERVMVNCVASTGFVITPSTACGGAGQKQTFLSPDTNQPNAYPNPALQFSGVSPPVDRSFLPQVGQDLFSFQPGKQGIGSGPGAPNTGLARIGVRWTLAPSSYSGAGTKSAYRMECQDIFCYSGTPDGLGGCNPDTRNRVGYTIGLFTTTNNGATWTSSSSASLFDLITDTNEPVMPINGYAQGGLQLFPVGGGRYLYIVTDGGRLKAGWYFGTVGDADTAPPASIVTATQFLDGTDYATNAGNQSGAVFDGTNIFYFEDQAAHESHGIGTISIPNGSVTVTGVSTRFLRDLKPGDVIFDQNLLPAQIIRFVVSSITSNTSLTLTAVNTGPAIAGDTYQISKAPGAVRLWWWNGTSMKRGIMSGFPALNGADFAHAMIDSTRGKMYVMSGKVLNRISFTFNAGTITLTATNIQTAIVDTPNYKSLVASNHPAALAWLAGPVDASMGLPGEQVPYATASDAIIVGTSQADYIYSDLYGGIIKVADFTGMSCSTALQHLIIIPQQAMLSGADLPTVPDPSVYTPQPTIFLKRRIVTTAAPFNATKHSISCQDELWIIQYNSVLVQNSLLLQNVQGQILIGTSILTGAVVNDRNFIFDAIIYKILAARYGGANALRLDNPFVFTTSVAKMIANAYAYELLIPRGAANLKIIDPYLVDGVTILQPLGRMTYLKRAPNAYGTSQTAAGRISKLSYKLETNSLDVEII